MSEHHFFCRSCEQFKSGCGGPQNICRLCRERAAFRRVRFLFAWYDLWVGIFIDTNKRRIYIFPLPMIGIVIEMRKP